MFSSRQSAREDLLLGVVRFRSLLENARGLMDLIQDGKEKSGGDYILDRQYIVSLIDGAVERIGKLVFDARVLRPQESDRLYAAFDDCKATARRLSSSAMRREDDARRSAERSGDWAESMESGLLLDAVRWMEGPTTSEELAPMELLDKVLDHAVCGLEPVVCGVAADRSMDVVTPHTRDRLDLVDLEGLEDWGEGKDAPITPLRNAPLRLMLAGAEEEEPQGASSDDRASRSWLAAIGDHELSLFSMVAGSRIAVEASFSGEPSDDFVFVSAKGVDDIRSLAAPGLTSRETDLGHHLWWCDLPPRDLEKHLIRLGAMLWKRDHRSNGPGQ